MLERYYVGASILVEQNFDKVRSLAHLLCRSHLGALQDGLFTLPRSCFIQKEPE